MPENLLFEKMSNFSLRGKFSVDKAFALPYDGEYQTAKPST